MNSSEAHKKSILIVLSRFPYPLEKGDKLRAYHLLKELSKVYKIKLVTLTDKDIPEEHFAMVKSCCHELHVYRINWLSKLLFMFTALLSGLPLQVGYFHSFKAKKGIRKIIKSNSIDHIFCQLIRTTEYVKEYPAIPKTLDYMDALSAGVERRISKQSFFTRWLFKLEAKRLKRYEQRIFDYFDNKVIISDQDRNLIHHPEKDRIYCIPNGIDSDYFNANTESKKLFDFVFVGNMSYPPNVDAAIYIVKEILPSFPKSKLLISGSNPHTSITHLASANKNIELTGWVDDIRNSYSSGKIFIAPMMIGTGMQNKLLEAMSMGIPCITTPLANNAIKAKDGEEILVAKNKETILEAIQKLMEDQTLYDTISRQGKLFVQKNYSWSRSAELLRDLIEK